MYPLALTIRGADQCSLFIFPHDKSSPVLPAEAGHGCCAGGGPQQHGRLFTIEREEGATGQQSGNLVSAQIADAGTRIDEWCDALGQLEQPLQQRRPLGTGQLVAGGIDPTCACG